MIEFSASYRYVEQISEHGQTIITMAGEYLVSKCLVCNIEYDGWIKECPDQDCGVELCAALLSEIRCCCGSIVPIQSPDPYCSAECAYYYE